MHVDYPWRYDTRGRTADSAHDDHVRDMLELLIFTDSGERVNRPEFGTGLRQLVFAPNSPELAAGLQFAMQAAIQRELGGVLSLESLSVSSEDASLRVVVNFIVLRTGQAARADFRREIA